MDFASEMVYNSVAKTAHSAKEPLKNLGVELDLKKLKPPYPVISYQRALDILDSEGFHFQYGKSFGVKEEAVISKQFDRPVWVKAMPRSVEPFPYKIDQSDSRATRTADLLAPHGYGEILGTAEKIDNVPDLLARMKEKKVSPARIKKYKWYIELRENGSVPHCGLGMGLERLLRWTLGLPRVIDTIPFPRLYGRVPYP